MYIPQVLLPAGSLSDHFVNNSPADQRRFSKKNRDRNDDRRLLVYNILVAMLRSSAVVFLRFTARLHSLSGLKPQKLFRFRCFFSSLCDVLRSSRVDPLQKGHHFAPQKISRIADILVGLVLSPCNSPFTEKFLDLPPAALQQRPDDPSVHRKHTAKPSQSAAARQIEEHGLRLVLQVMCDCDPAAHFSGSRCVLFVLTLSAVGIRRVPAVLTLPAAGLRHVPAALTLPAAGLRRVLPVPALRCSL